jgi:hypothetical protein
MEYDQRVIIRFLWNDRTDAHENRHRLQALFGEYVMHFKLFDSGLQRYGPVVKTSMMKFTTEDFLWMILMQKLWLYWTNLLLNPLVE